MLFSSTGEYTFEFTNQTEASSCGEKLGSLGDRGLSSSRYTLAPQGERFVFSGRLLSW